MTTQRTCPYESANWLSKATFWWTNAFMLKGFRQTLQIDDVYDCVKNHESAHLAEQLERNWEAEVKRRGEKGRFLNSVFWTFAVDILYPGIFFLILTPIELLQPYVIGLLISYFEDENFSLLSAYLYAASLGLMGLIMTVVDAQYFYAMECLSMRVKTAVSALIYRKKQYLFCSSSFEKTMLFLYSHLYDILFIKVVRLRSADLQTQSSGHIVNLLSSDVDKFQLVFESTHFLWHSPLILSMIVYLMWRELGISALLGLLVFVLYFPIQFSVSRMVGKIRLNLAQWGDKRIGFMNEIIAGMNVIKLYCWERPFGRRINDLRRKEMKYVRQTQSVHALVRGFEAALPNLMGIIIYVSAWSLGVKLTTYRVFTVYAWLLVLGRDENYFVAAYTELAVSMKRVQEFLLIDEKSQSMLPMSNDTPGKADCEISDVELKPKEKTSFVEKMALKDEAVIISGVTAHMSCEISKMDANVKPEHGGAILQNNSPVSDIGDSVFTLSDLNLTMQKGEFVAIVGQVGSGKTSILMTVLSEVPPDSGSICVNGSVGYVPQKAWVFSGTLRDNVLFGMSYDAGRYQKCLEVCQLLSDIEVMSNRDQTLVGERGLRLSGGQKARITLARAVYRDADIYLFDDPLSAVDNNVGREIFNSCMCEMLTGKTRILVTHQLQYLEQVDRVIVMNEGKITHTGTWRDLQHKGLDISTFLSDDDPKRDRVAAATYFEGTIRDVKEDQERENQAEEERLTGGVDWHVYKNYLKYGKGQILAPIAFVIGVLTWGSYSTSDWYLAQWVGSCVTTSQYNNRSSVLHPNPDDEGFTILSSGNETGNETFVVSGSWNARNTSSKYEWPNMKCYSTYMYLYLGFYALHVISQQIFYHLAFSFCSTASRSLHNTMFSNILIAKLRFFDTNPVGRVLNRFSRDLGMMDGSLAENIIRYINITMRLMTLSIVTCIINPWLFLALVPLIGVIIALRYFSARAMRDTRRLEAVARSPVYSHLSETLNGLTSIRSYQMGSQFVKTFDDLQNTHTTAWFLFLSTYRWFGFRSRTLVVVYVFLTAMSSVAVKGVSGSLFALALVYVIDMCDPLEYSIRLTSRIENLMTSVERVLSYTSLDIESAISPQIPPKQWPETGEICLNNVSLRYNPDLPDVLRGITCEIKHGEKIGIVGRTGAGKSSLLVSLFRLAEPTGQIWIDGIDVTQIGLYDLRRNISVIPQDPVLFYGTLRYNLDPFEEHHDVKLWRVLDQVQLKERIEESGSLDMVLAEGGSNLSMGQRQLVCLARAMLRGNKILVLDEATANVDNRTDELIQESIRLRFKGCTVLTVAHRLHTVMDSDRIMVIHDGEVKEFDHPYVLLQHVEGYFTKMVEQTGPSQTENLRVMAAEHYKNQHEETKL